MRFNKKISDSLGCRRGEGEKNWDLVTKAGGRTTIFGDFMNFIQKGKDTVKG